MKTKVLVLSGVIPALNRGGGCMALHRHFVERSDFSIAVAGSYLDGSTADRNVSLGPGRIQNRLMRTPLCRLVENSRYVASWYRMPQRLKQFISEWRPDVIFTVADNLHLGWAYQASRHFRLPLAVNFQDLFPHSNYIAPKSKPYSPIVSFLMRRYSTVNQEADAVFYTSEGMCEWFGGSPRGRVLYPIGAETAIQLDASRRPQRPVKLLYAGNCLAAYGRMLLQLANQLQGNQDIHLSIFTAGNDWSSSDQERLSDAGILKGYRPFDELEQEMAGADAFLTLMSFEETERTLAMTSFTTKWLDYVPFAKPVFVWGPDYSSAVLFGKKHECASLVTSPDPEHLCCAVRDLMTKQYSWERLSRCSALVAQGPLNPTVIHSVLERDLSRLGQRRDGARCC